MPIDPASLPRLTVNLEHGDTDDQFCWSLPMTHFEEVTAPSRDHPGFGAMEVDIAMLVLPADLDRDWFDQPRSRWLRKKVTTARRAGYTFAPFHHDDHLDDIFEINTSRAERQGREMSEEYRTRPPRLGATPAQPCPRHQVQWFGVFRAGRLYAYLQSIQIGEVTSTPNILGHGDHLEDGIMALLLFETAVHQRRRANTAYLYYYFYESSGTTGMHFFKEKMGYAPYVVHWELNRRSYVG